MSGTGPVAAHFLFSSCYIALEFTHMPLVGVATETAIIAGKSALRPHAAYAAVVFSGFPPPGDEPKSRNDVQCALERFGASAMPQAGECEKDNDQSDHY
jgi:hypothetical protein